MVARYHYSSALPIASQNVKEYLGAMRARLHSIDVQLDGIQRRTRLCSR
jgi:hypothetical protein